MIPVIQSMGAFTSIGSDIPMTMAALVSEFQGFDDLPVEGSDGEAVTGAMTPLPASLSDSDRLAALGLFAMQECAAGAPPGPDVPLFVCASERQDGSEEQSELLAAVTDDAAIKVDLGQSRVFPDGRAGLIDALQAGCEILAAGRANAFYLLGVDSFVTATRARRLVEAGRVLDGEHSDGFVPGEGAVALRFSATKEEGVAALVGLGRGREPAAERAEAPMTGAGLHQAAQQAVAQAGLRGADLRALVHDVSGAQRDFEDFLLARGRPPLDSATAARVFAPSFSVGEIGAAAGPLALAMLAFFIQKKVLEGPGLCLVRSGGPARGAVAVAPVESVRGRGHG
jgi:3-oxoacyl-[acyl-carrier-protein] synthase-1